MIWLWLAAACMIATALTHSILGERRLITPLLAIDAPLIKSPLARGLLRFAWHLTSLLMMMLAVMTVWPDTPNALIIFNGLLWLGVGLFDAFYTKGKHIGWPMLSLSGFFALIGSFV